MKKANFFGMYIGCRVINTFTPNLIGNILKLNYIDGYVDLIPCKDTIEFYQYQSIVAVEEKYDKQYDHKGDELSIYSKYVRKYKNNPIENCKLILRPLDADKLTDKEKMEIFSLTKECSEVFSPNLHPMELLEYYIEHGLDIFNLKEKGFAIYESDL